MAFWRKKEEKKKFDYSDETKELFAEKDAFVAEQRRKLGGETSNPELSNQPGEESKPEENLDDLLGGGDFNPYVNKDESPDTSQTIPSASPAPSTSGFVCVSCDKNFPEKWGKCPSCGGEMKKAESTPAPEPEITSTPTSTQPPTDVSAGDPLDDLLGDFGTSDSAPPPEEESPSGDESGVRMVSDDDLSADFGQSVSSHSNRKRVRKVKKVKRPRKSP
jgi:hypothetical protein